MFILASVVVVVWQLRIIGDEPFRAKTDYFQQLIGNDRIEKKYTAEARGLYDNFFRRYFTFFYYTGFFPVSLRYYNHPKTKERALRLLEPGNGSSLRSEIMASTRAGDLGKIFLYFPQAWRQGFPQEAHVRFANRIVGVSVLIILLFAFYKCNQLMLGVILVAILGSNPFQIYEMYFRNNVLGYNIATAILVFALSLPFIFQIKMRDWKIFSLLILAATVIAFAKQIRSEPSVIVVSFLGVLTFYRCLGFRRRLINVLLFVFMLGAQLFVWSSYWDFKLAEGDRVVERAGGIPYDGERLKYHHFWHLFWCGLGDFGGDKGFVRSDREAYAFGIPKVNEKYGTNYRRSRPESYWLENRYPARKAYNMKPENVPGYQEILRDHIISTVKSNPLWFVNIIYQRILRTFNKSVPLRIQLPSWYIEIPFSSWFFLPFVAFLIYCQNWLYLKLLLFMLPLSATAILIHSGSGFTYYSLFPHMTFCLGLHLVITNRQRIWRKLRIYSSGVIHNAVKHNS